MKQFKHKTLLARASMMLLAMLCFLGGARATEVEIGDGGATNNSYLPGYNYYNYSLTQQIYTADEIGMAGTINSISFKNTGTEKTRTYKVYMLLTDKETFSDGTDWVAMSDGDKVFEGELTFTVGEWTTIDLDAPFAYDGSSNLIVGVADVTGGYSSSPHMACLVFDATSQAIRAYRDASAFDVSAPGVTGTVLNVKNQIVLDITPAGSTVCLKPTLSVSDITDNAATLTWSGGSNTYNVQYREAGADDWTDVPTGTTETSCTLNSLSPLTTYEARVQSVCDSETTSDWRTVSFTTTAVAVAVGNSWSDDFEGSSCDWELINGTCTNAWAWGTATNNDETHALYISNDGGETYAYSDSYTMVYATKLLNFTEGKYEFSYNWLANGEGTWDYLRVALVPASVTLIAGTSVPSGFSAATLPTGWIALDGGSKLNLATEWQNKTATINVAAGNYYFVLAWCNDNSTNNNPPAAIDNVSISRVTCSVDVEELAVSDITTTGATLTWAAGGATQWQVTYSDNSLFEGATQTIVSSAILVIDDLDPSTHYFAKVRTYCGGEDYGTWSGVIQFNTDCNIINTYPWSENFDGYTVASAYTPTARTLPVCWNAINTSTYSSYAVYPSIYNYGSSPNCLRMYSAYSSYSDYDPQDQYVILPAMENLNGKQITLKVKGNAATSTFKIGMMTDPTDVSTFSVIATQEGLTTSYQDFEYILSGSGNYVAIMIEAATSDRTGNGIYIDDIVIREAPSCLKPTDLNSTNITENSAELSWTAGGSETEWTIYYKKTTDENYIEVTDVTENPYTLEGLNAATTYQFYVVANCSDTDTSDPSSAYSFTTDCGVITSLPWTENFDSYTGSTGSSALSSYPNDKMPICWIFLNRSETSSTYPQVFISSNSGYPVSGKCLFFKSSKTTPLYAVLPTFEDDIARLQLTFTYRNEGTSDSNGTLIVGYMTNLEDATTFTAVHTCEKTTSLTEQEVFFSDAPANSYIAFMYQGGTSDNYYLSIDNVTIDEAPSCLKPTDLSANNITAHSADLSWTAGGSEEEWTIYYKKSADGNYTAITGVDENPYTLEGLDPSTIYDFCVVANCSDIDESDPSNVYSFTTTCEPYTITASAPYTQDFESPVVTTGNSDTGEVPACWDNYPFDSKGPKILKAGDTYNYAEGQVLYFYGSGNGYAALPEFTNALNELQITFKWATENTSYGTLTLGYITNEDDNFDTFTEIISYPASSTSYHNLIQAEPVVLSGLPANATRLVFRWYYSAWYACNIDDVIVSLPGANVTFAKEGYATYYNSENDIVLPTGMKAHIVTANAGGNKLTYETIADGNNTEDNVVPAGTAVMLQIAESTTSQTKVITFATKSGSPATGNLLQGSDEETLTTGEEGDVFYMLSYGKEGTDNADVIGWYWKYDDGSAFTNGAHKAWLALPASTGAPFFGLPGWEDTTGIIGIDNGQLTIDNGEWYTLQGLKIGKKPTTKGVYIHNGKKVLIP